MQIILTPRLLTKIHSKHLAIFNTIFLMYKNFNMNKRACNKAKIKVITKVQN